MIPRAIEYTSLPPPVVAGRPASSSSRRASAAAVRPDERGTADAAGRGTAAAMASGPAAAEIGGKSRDPACLGASEELAATAELTRGASSIGLPLRRTLQCIGNRILRVYVSRDGIIMKSR